MKVVRDRSGEYSDCGYRYLDFERFDDGSTEEAFFYGYDSGRNKQLINEHRDYKRKIFYQGEQPCGFYSLNATERRESLTIGDNFDEIYTTCPYSARWMNDIHGYDKYRPAIFPHNSIHAVGDDPVEKTIDVMYWGNLPNGSVDVRNIIETIPKFNHVFYTLGHGLTPDLFPHITGMGVPRTEMWATLKHAKVMVTSNLLYITPAEIAATKSLDRWKENGAFALVDEAIMPQIKTRPIEAIFNKTLVLLKEDPWHVFDYWFEPGVDFLYYEKNEDLEWVIGEIVTNWDNYKHIPESAYKKAMELYTSERLYRDIEKGQSEFKFK